MVFNIITSEILRTLLKNVFCLEIRCGCSNNLFVWLWSQSWHLGLPEALGLTRPPLLCVAQTLLPTTPEPQGSLSSGSGAVDAGPRSPAQAFSAPPLGGGDQGLKRNKIRPTSKREQTTSNQRDREPFSKDYSLCWALFEHILNLMRKGLCDFIPSGLLFSRIDTFSFSTWEFCFIGCLDKYKVTSYLSDHCYV